jgi:hypothetical protein
MNSKATGFVRIVVLVGLTVVTTAFALAQDSSSSTPQDGDSASPAPVTKAVESSNPISGSPKPAGRVYLALGSDRLFTLNPMLKTQLLFQMDLTEGYDDGIVLAPRVETYYTLWTPRLAFLGRTPKSEYVIQYTPAVAYFGNTPIGLQSLQQVSGELHTEVNSYWGWDTSFNFVDGSYPVSLLSPFNFFAVNDIAIVNIDSILLLSTASYLTASASVGLHWKPTPKDLFVLRTTYDYANFPPNDIPGSVPGHVNRGILAVNYTRSVSERLNLLANANAVHVFGPLARTTTGALYSSYGSGLTDTLAAGVMREWGPLVDARVDAGYIRVESLPTIPNSYNAQGKFISGRVDWTMAPPLVLSLQYSRIYETITGMPFNRNQVFMELQLRPNPKAAF